MTGSLTISDNVTSIGTYAFYNCHGLTGTLSIPNSVTSMGSSVFSSCYGFTSVEIPDTWTTINSPIITNPIPDIKTKGATT